HAPARDDGHRHRGRADRARTDHERVAAEGDPAFRTSYRLASLRAAGGIRNPRDPAPLRGGTRPVRTAAGCSDGGARTRARGAAAQDPLSGDAADTGRSNTEAA